MQANNEHNFECRPFLNEMHCLQKIFDHRRRTCDPKIQLSSPWNLLVQEQTLSLIRDLISQVCIQTLESSYSSYECWDYRCFAVRSCVHISQLTSCLVPLLQNVLKLHKLRDVIMKYADVQTWFINLDRDNSFLTSVYLGNMDSKPN